VRLGKIKCAANWVGLWVALQPFLFCEGIAKRLCRNLHCRSVYVCRLMVALSGLRVADNVSGLSEVGPKVQSILVFTSPNILKIVYEDVRPHLSKPVLCTVDVLWFSSMVGQRSFRPHSYSIHSQRQKASRSLQFTHSIFTAIYDAYKALSSVRQCQGLGPQKNTAAKLSNSS
jgi:hypothetical protein